VFYLNALLFSQKTQKYTAYTMLA